MFVIVFANYNYCYIRCHKRQTDRQCYVYALFVTFFTSGKKKPNELLHIMSAFLSKIRITHDTQNGLKAINKIRAYTTFISFLFSMKNLVIITFE